MKYQINERMTVFSDSLQSHSPLLSLLFQPNVLKDGCFRNKINTFRIYILGYSASFYTNKLADKDLQTLLVGRQN